MNRDSNAGAILLVIVAAAVIGALAVAFLILPQYNAATTATDDLEIARQDNELLELQIQQMQALAAQVPGWEEEIALVQGELPPTAEEAELRRLIVAAVTDNDLPLVSLAIGGAQAVAPGSSEDVVQPTEEQPVAEEGEEPAAEPEPTATAGTDDAPPADDQPASDPLVQFEGLYGFPVAIQTEGSPTDILQLIDDLQSQSDRFYTVSALNVTGADPTEEQPGRRELDYEDWTVVINAFVFALVDEELSFPEDETGSVPGFDRRVDNSFEPLDGQVEDN